MASLQSDTATIPENAPDTDRVLREVFLTPRVIDRRVYDELAEGLRSLIVRAGGEQRSLEQSRSEATKVGDRLDRASEDMKARLRTAARMLEALEERVGRAEAAAKAAEERATAAGVLVRKLEKELSGRIEAQAEAFEQKLRRSVLEAEARVSKAAEAAALHASQVQEQFEQQSDRALEMLEQAGVVDERAARTVKRLESLAGDLQERFEAQTDAAIALVLAEAEKAGPATAATKLAAEYQERFEQQANAALAQIERAGAEAVARLGRTGGTEAQMLEAKPRARRRNRVKADPGAAGSD